MEGTEAQLQAPQEQQSDYQEHQPNRSQVETESAQAIHEMDPGGKLIPVTTEATEVQLRTRQDLSTGYQEHQPNQSQKETEPAEVITIGAAFCLSEPLNTHLLNHRFQHVKLKKET